VVGVAASGHATSLATKVIVLSEVNELRSRSGSATPILLTIAISLPLLTWLGLTLLARRRRSRGQPTVS
jgi:hypothetical protein